VETGRRASDVLQVAKKCAPDSFQSWAGDCIIAAFLGNVLESKFSFRLKFFLEKEEHSDRQP